MATLVEGQEYGLASNGLSDSNKTVIHFKLTESALKTLEDFSRINNEQASIQFSGNQGVIRIPSHNLSDGQQPERNFQFSLSALQGDANGSFDCIQQTVKNGAGSLQSLGSMQHKVVLRATDDVYGRTRTRMAMAEEENKKICTKEIKPSGRHISKKVKKVLDMQSLRVPNSTKPPPPAALPRPSRPGPVSTSSTTSNSSSSLPVSSFSSSMAGRVASGSTTASLHSHSQQNRPHQVPPSSSSPSSTSKPVGNTTTSSSRVLTSSSPKPTSGAINMPYRDRVIHLLALKPYKRPELILRLQRDGIREKDKNSLSSTLQQVATLNKDNSYTLARAAWLDVRQEWGFYTDVDRALLKRNLQEARVTPTSPAVSPASSNPESPGSSQKRVLDEAEDHVPPNPSKKKRIAHSGRQQGERLVSVVKPLPTKQTSPNANRENLEGSAEDSNPQRSDFESLAPIAGVDQRHKYKQEFNKEYKEYRNLHKEVDTVARRFQNLRSQIDRTEEGSPDFEVVKKQVLEEYEAQKSDLKFMEKKQRMEHLHQKLGYIKRLIHDFDHRQQQVCS